MRRPKHQIGTFLLGLHCLFFSMTAVPCRAETQIESSMFFRIYVAFKVPSEAVQLWLPGSWEAVQLPRGPFEGANLYVIFDDKFVKMDGEGKSFKDGTYCNAALLAFGKHSESGEFAPFVIRIYWPFDDPNEYYQNAFKASVRREMSQKDSDATDRTAMEDWLVQDQKGGLIAFSMEYRRSPAKRQQGEFKVRSNIKADEYLIYRDDYASELVKSIPAGVDRTTGIRFLTTMAELRDLFDGSEEMVGVSVMPTRVREVFLP
jgi:hypothetical protein